MQQEIISEGRMVNIIKKLLGKKGSPANLIPAHKCGINIKEIDKNALSVVNRIMQNNYSAYIVGGAVRDLFLGMQPKDYDVATSATPNQIKKIFKNCILIGKRFRLAHIRFGRDIVEVATFRGEGKGFLKSRNRVITNKGLLLRDNVFGAIDDDVSRRDFTINALYLDVDKGVIIDYVGGVEDLNKKVLRSLGSPKIKYQEDPVRMIRAIRYSSKLGFSIAPETKDEIFKNKGLIKNVST